MCLDVILNELDRVNLIYLKLNSECSDFNLYLNVFTLKACLM